MPSSLVSQQLIHETAQVHGLVLVQHYLTNSSITIISHSPVISSDYLMFPIMKSFLDRHTVQLLEVKKGCGVETKGSHRKSAIEVILVV
jgi:hypothetical protein